ncbi:chemotaxis protein MotA [Alkalithermobacter thermoalcaliphilus JW-YL-7 = DSM 7308]|uniref:Chemotaxis protein MotA n=1 Tax=Alkalithermobacter thermoalcaliphilus JW-YL-7 = DSM 7308 TaxID=1121328 RepID=A0A150FQ93_CLOPD|nr:MotA/TolQ/ExbB proton channel [[Clostridium] paradoxum JW-YL-7 = DSM 7308]SHK61122.1 chemotaxis protein MotA [[Clostridium] paradoxum JW-YL-7 = DSM 7308]
MDLGTLIGIASGFILIAIGILSNGSILTFLDPASMMIVMGGTIAATFVAYPLPKVLESGKIVKKAFQTRKGQSSDIIQSIIDLANKARKEGLLALEELANEMEDEFMKKGIVLIVDGTDPELVRNLLETELSFIEERHKVGQGLFETMGSFAPAFGMVGTLIGLINMLRKLDDPSTIGPAMAVALITTFYGSLLANLIFLPIANKLKVKSRDELLEKEIIVEGLLSIQAGENPRIIEEKLKAFLSPAMRKSPEGRVEENA